MDDTFSIRRAYACWVALAGLALGGCAHFYPVGTTATNILRHAQEDPDPNVRFVAYNKLASPNVYDNQEQKENVVRVLIKRLELANEPAASRAAICRTLGEIGLPEARDAMRRAVDDPEGLIRVEACRALGKVGREEDAVILSRIMAADALLDANVAAIEGLASLKPKDPRILQVLVQGMDNDRPAIRYASLKALRSMTGKDFGIQPQPWREYVQPMLQSNTTATAIAPPATEKK